LELKRQQVESLKVRAGIDGILQKLGDQTQLQLGQQMGAGSFLARVANHKKLMAEIKIPETQARDVELDQPAEIDTRNGIIPGHVVRKDPAAQNGTVTVDVALDGPLPKGAVPDQSVDGNIQLEKLDDVIYVARPVSSQSESTMGIFKVVEGGKAAIRVPVKFGRSSVSFIQVVEGLQPGDKVVLSEMSAWDAYQRVRLD
jgi:HlyD family secretion protein